MVRRIEPNRVGENLRVMPKKNQPQAGETENNDGRRPISVYGTAMQPPVPSHTKNKGNGTEQ
jgi:hypothetical protein